MARENPRNCHDYTKMIRLLSLVTLVTIHGAASQRVEVEPEVMSYPGQLVHLRCAWAEAGGSKPTQVSWIYEPEDGERRNIAVFHPSFGANYPSSPQKGRVRFTSDPPTLDHPSIQISDAKTSDEGKYICEYATYPSGNEQGITSLVMLAKPRNSASTVTVVAEADSVVVAARCESLDGRPAAQIAWVSAAVVNGNGTSVSRPGAADGTVSVTSEYRMIATATDNGKEVSCVVTHRTQVRPESFHMKLAVEYPPQVSIVGYDDNWYVGRTNVVLTCQASGNPTPTSLTWNTLSGEMPDTVVVSENRLTVLKVDESVNCTFVCEVKNRLGSGKDQVTAMVRVSVEDLTRERDQLQTSNINLTRERDQLQTSNEDLTRERDQLQTSNNNLIRERDQLQSSYNTLKEREDLQKRLCENIDGWTRFGCSCYYVSTEWKTWEESRLDCIRRGADLVIVNNREEQDFLVTFKKEVWIGLTDGDVEGIWTWVDGTPLTTAYWYGGGKYTREPDHGKYREDKKEEDCAMIYPDFEDPVNKWADVPCGSHVYWVCERGI